MTTSSFVPIEQVIATAASVMEGADTVDRAYFKEWIYIGLTELGPNTAWYDEAIVYPIDLDIRKPENIYSVIDIALYDVNMKELNYALRGKGSRIHLSDNSLINSAMYGPSLGAPIDLSEDSYYFHLGTNGAAVASAKIKYWRYPVDDNGDLLIPEQDVLPLTIFCKYMYYMRKDDKVGMGQFHNLWIAARNEARGAHKIPSELEGTELARSWNSMIQKMRFKKF